MQHFKPQKLQSVSEQDFAQTARPEDSAKKKSGIKEIICPEPCSPIWQKAFALADNVRFTRTPDKEIIRRRAAADPAYAKAVAEIEERENSRRVKAEDSSHGEVGAFAEKENMRERESCDPAGQVGDDSAALSAGDNHAVRFIEGGTAANTHIEAEDNAASIAKAVADAAAPKAAEQEKTPLQSANMAENSDVCENISAADTIAETTDKNRADSGASDNGGGMFVFPWERAALSDNGSYPLRSEEKHIAAEKDEVSRSSESAEYSQAQMRWIPVPSHILEAWAALAQLQTPRAEADQAALKIWTNAEIPAKAGMPAAACAVENRLPQDNENRFTQNSYSPHSSGEAAEAQRENLRDNNVSPAAPALFGAPEYNIAAAVSSFAVNAAETAGRHMPVINSAPNAAENARLRADAAAASANLNVLCSSAVERMRDNHVGSDNNAGANPENAAFISEFSMAAKAADNANAEDARKREQYRESSAFAAAGGRAAHTDNRFDTADIKGGINIGGGACIDENIAPLYRGAVAECPAPASICAAETTQFARKDVKYSYRLPSMDLLQEAIHHEENIISQETLERCAGLLENVLEDFGVKGEIIHVRPGPVVTLYEFEPAPGVKSSRVIGLSDDIARSMSAIAARVAVIPGRNVIGIELPNKRREMVYLREILQSQAYRTSDYKLPLALGKNIGGEPVIAELAKMPHLLVAGTTGSGKSVAINTMILSLLYRMTPQECRLIMVDPKMLELSVYEGIPHLLTPVVTDPKKALSALKWAVREMEERYRKMAKLGVRNIDGFNARVREAARKNETIMCNVQAGFDKETGELLYREEAMDLTSLPYIVVIIDEMADLMMVAGKEIEGAIQRLAQMARAAGIHVIMATQRPSVDVITGTIKANFPTRISFQVTGKIDSRTILGEQGAETLLGQGDMLQMAGGGRLKRVHGPFVSDREVEKVVAHLKTQGTPEYLAVVTESSEEDAEGKNKTEIDEELSAVAEIVAAAGGGDDFDELYLQAVKIVMRDKKCSTSYIQRRLGIGYNKAATLVEKMEAEGLVGEANHVGKREILINN